MRTSLLFLFLLLTLVSSRAFEVDGIYYKITSSTSRTVEVTYTQNRFNPNVLYINKTFYEGDIIIPSTVTYNNKKYTVTSIGDSAFWDSSDLLSVSLPNTIKSIGKESFCDCSKLTSISLPASLTSIGNSAFAGCALTSIVIPSSVKDIGDYAFVCCDELLTVELPNSNINFGKSIFYMCRRLNPVYTEKEFIYLSLISIYDEYVVPDGIECIVDGAFRDCSCLSITLPSSLKK